MPPGLVAHGPRNEGAAISETSDRGAPLSRTALKSIGAERPARRMGTSARPRCRYSRASTRTSHVPQRDRIGRPNWSIRGERPSRRLGCRVSRRQPPPACWRVEVPVRRLAEAETLVRDAALEVDREEPVVASGQDGRRHVGGRRERARHGRRQRHRRDHRLPRAPNRCPRRVRRWHRSAGRSSATTSWPASRTSGATRCQCQAAPPAPGRRREVLMPVTTVPRLEIIAAELSAVPGDSAGSPEVAVEPGEAPGPHGLADWPGFVPPTYRRLARIRLRFEHERTASRHIGSHLLPTRGPSWRRHRIVAEPAAHPRLLLPRRTEQFPSEFVACHWESGCRARRDERPARRQHEGGSCRAASKRHARAAD